MREEWAVARVTFDAPLASVTIRNEKGDRITRTITYIPEYFTLNRCYDYAARFMDAGADKADGDDLAERIFNAVKAEAA